MEPLRVNEIAAGAAVKARCANEASDSKITRRTVIFIDAQRLHRSCAAASSQARSASLLFRNILAGCERLAHHHVTAFELIDGLQKLEIFIRAEFWQASLSFGFFVEFF
jgi:hypothetical protein